MQLPTENNNIRLLHADAASLVVSARQIPPPSVYLYRYLVINILRNFTLLNRLHSCGVACFCV